MGFVSFLGRVLFASLFIFSAWQMYNDFGQDGGRAVKEFVAKIEVAKKLLPSNLVEQIPDIDTIHLSKAIIIQKGIGGLLFIFGYLPGAYLLLLQLFVTTPILYDFYNYGRDSHKYSTLLNEFLQNVALFGALLYFIGMRNSIPRRHIKKKAPKPKAN